MDYLHDFRQDIVLKNMIKNIGIIGKGGIYYTKH